MIPQFVRQTRPAVAAQSSPGLAAAANAQVGREIMGLGMAIRQWADRKMARSDALAASRAWRQLESWHYEYLQGLPGRRQSLAATTLDPETQRMRTGYEAELTAYPDAAQAQYDRLSEGLSADAKAALEMRYNSVAANWSAQAVDALDRLEMEDVAGEILGLSQQDRASDAMELLELHRDRFSPETATRIEAAVAESSRQSAAAAARTQLRAVAQESGWQAARDLIADPGFQALYGLDLAEAAETKRQIETFVKDEASLAESQAKAAAAARSDDWFVACEKGELAVDDETTLGPDAMLEWGLDQVAKGELSYADYAAGKKLLTPGPQEVVDDLDIYAQAQAKLSAVRADSRGKADALDWLRGQRGKLRPETYKGFVADIERAGDPADPMGSPTAKLLDGLIDENFYTVDYGDHKGELTFGGMYGSMAESAWIDTKLRFRNWVTKHPEATDAELVQYYKEFFVEPIVRPGVLRRISDWLNSNAETSGYGKWYPQDITLEQPQSEPQTYREFIETVWALPKGSREQTDYYERWHGKWQ